MKTLKKTVALLLVISALFSLFGCGGEYQYAESGGKPNTDNSQNGDNGGGEQDPPEMNGDPTDDFTVTVLADGEPFSPRMDMYVYWSDGFSMHSAPLGEDGVARIDGLDGDYRVTLSAVPNEYTYDPNSNIATNDDRNIVLELYTLNRLAGSGTGIYDCYTFRSTGVYSAVIESPEDAIYFQYAPSESGTYTIESWMDTTADNVNPYIDVYGGHSQYKYYIKTTNDGGAVGSYTINFVHTVQIAKENISAGGQATYTFAVKAESKNGKYPITVTFAVKRNGGFELDAASRVTGMAIPTLDFSKVDREAHEYGDGYEIVYPEYRFSENSDIFVFDEERFKLWETDDGGDGFYHVYDTEKYPETDGFGPILYANITTPCRFIDRAFSVIEYDEDSGETINSALSAGGLNYKHFIEGYAFLSYYGNVNGGTYYCVSECPCHDIGESPYDWACTSECTSCHKDCRRIPEELIGNQGYQSIANSDGMVPVTEEIKTFLYSYCMKEIFFYDGKGTCENRKIDGKYFQAVGSSGWLFGCAYYEQK